LRATPYAIAHQAIGRYFCAFSALEQALGEVIKVIFRLEQHETGDAIIAALGDVARKINLVWTGALRAKNQDGSEPSDHWKENVNETMKEIHECNSQGRVPLAHSFLEPRVDGSLALARLKADGGELKGEVPKIWSQDDFNIKVDRLQVLTKKLQTVACRFFRTFDQATASVCMTFG
jgi:hypothetical protein